MSPPAAHAGAPLAAPPPAQRIHVLQVVGNAIVGGMEHWVERLIERLPAQDFLFTALCPFESAFTERLRALDVEVLITPMPLDPPWSSIQMAASLVDSGGIDLLHAHLPAAHLLAGIVGRLTAKPVLTTVHARQMSTLDLEVHRAAGTHVSVVCRQSYLHALGLGVSAGHLSCDTNGVDTQVFRPWLRPRLGGLRRELGLDETTPLVGFVGRIEPEKGPDIFVRAAMMLHAWLPQAHAVLVGEGPMQDEMRELIQRFSLGGCVHMTGVRDDMPQVYNALDLMVSCSHSEAMPLALMEAMASGVVAVATAVGGVPDIVEHGHSGWLVQAGDFDDIAGRCAWLLQDHAARTRMAARARQRAVDKLDLAQSVERVGQLLTRLAKPRGDTSRRVPQVAPVVTVPATSPVSARRSAAARTLPAR